MALYSIGASWNPKMSQYNRSIKRGLTGIHGLSFAYRLNQWGPKVGPPMLPGNLAGPITWIEGVFGFASPADILSGAKDTLTTDLNSFSTALTQIQNYLTQIQAYDGSAKIDIQTRAQALEAQASGLAGTINNLQTTGGVLLGNVTTAQADSTTSKDAATALKTQVDGYDTQVQAAADAIKQLGKDTASLLKDAGASPGVVAAIENTVLGSVSTLTWILGGSLAAYFLLPSFLPRLAGGLRKTVRGS